MKFGNADPTERRRRTMIGATMVMLTIGSSALLTTLEHSDHWRPVDLVKVGGILTMAFVLALRSTTPIRFTPRDPALDDESARANRASAAGWGFWLLMPALLAMFIANFYWPLNMREILPVLIIIGAAAAGVRFAFLEGRGARE